MTFPTMPPANPFYCPRTQPSPPMMVPLPRIPRNGSPVPHLTSLYYHDASGPYGDRRYPGNCGGLLIRDLLNYFQPKEVFDPMTGSGTCRDVCRELELPCYAFDLKSGFDACELASYQHVPIVDFIWAHPPYWRQKVYSDSASCLSQSPTLDHFATRYGQFIANAASVLKPGGHFAILMGDYSDRHEGFVSLTHLTKTLAFRFGLQQACTDIIRFSHGASSSRRSYRSAFIPGLHDVCMVFTKVD